MIRSAVIDPMIDVVNGSCYELSRDEYSDRQVLYTYRRTVVYCTCASEVTSVNIECRCGWYGKQYFANTSTDSSTCNVLVGHLP